MLWAQVLKAKYFPHTTLFVSPQTSRSSHIWIAFSIEAKLLLGGMSWIVEDGQIIQIWKDPWLPQGSFRSYIEGPLLPHDDNSWVSSLRTNHSWSFDSFTLPLPP